MGSAFELVSFVARSANRLDTLRALSADPQRRVAVQEATGIARATLSRILADCAERDLVERRGPDYALTPLGERLVDRLDALFDDLDRLRALQTLATWLPAEELDVDLFDLDDLAVTLPNRVDPIAPIGRAADVVGAAAVVRGFCYSLLHAPILAMTRDIVETGGRFVGVVSADVLRHVAGDPELMGPVRDLLATGQAEVYVYEGGIGTQFIVTEDRVLFLIADDDGAVQGLVETTDPAVRPWAERRFATHREASEPLDPGSVSELLTS